MSPRPRSSSSMTSLSFGERRHLGLEVADGLLDQGLGVCGRHAMRDPIPRHGLRAHPVRAGRPRRRRHDRPAGADERRRARGRRDELRDAWTPLPRRRRRARGDPHRRREEAFCAGGDLKAAWEGDLVVDRGAATTGILGPTRWTDLAKPTIAAVNGVAYAGGLEWACWTDLCIADEHATFGVTCRRWNIGLGDGGTQRLPRIVGHRVAMELILTGRVIDAHEAHRIGLVNEVVPRGTCLAARASSPTRSPPCPSRRCGRTRRRPSAARAGRSPRGCGSRRSASRGSSAARRWPRGCGASTSATTRTARDGPPLTPGLTRRQA